MKSLKSSVLKYRRSGVVTLHLAVALLMNYLAFLLRFDGNIPPAETRVMLATLPVLLLLRGIAFYFFRLNEGLWRYASIWDLRNIIIGVLTSSAMFFIYVHVLMEYALYPRSVFIIDVILLISAMGGMRLTKRIHREFRKQNGGRRILVYGAGDAGELIVRDIRNNPFYGFSPVGFVDDDANKRGQRIHGLPVLGSRHDLESIIAKHKPDEVLIAMPAIAPDTIREIVQFLHPHRVGIKTLPNLRDIVEGKPVTSQIRDLAIEDLLARAPVGLSTDPLRGLIEGQRIMVTGAGGSIGSELCRQIASYNPAALILVERHENALYQIEDEFVSAGKGDMVHAVLADVTDKSRIVDVFSRLRPNIVFHAAAHKHVPLMENNVCECIINNIKGTRILAEQAIAFQCRRFIFISTDKAVNPTSVMGETKRVGELLIQGMNQEAKDTHFVAVRFGNVLGSNGSVVPRFMNQIRAGGPVTVTDPEVRRYFMLIPEAVLLVLHAAAAAEEPGVYVLEMGEQIKLVDLARNLIRLAGHVPDKDIKIEIIGLRPGDKIAEELVAADETVEKCAIDKILRVRHGQHIDAKALMKKLQVLEALAVQRNVSAALAAMTDIINPAPAADKPVTSVRAASQ